MLKRWIKSTWRSLGEQASATRPEDHDLIMEALEPRLLFDASPLAMAGEAVADMDDVGGLTDLEIEDAQLITDSVNSVEFATAASGALLQATEDGQDVPIAFSAADLDIDKDVIDTSSTDTTGTDLAVGEEVTFRLTINVAEGLSGSLLVTDTLPGGLTFIDGTVSVTIDPTILSTDYVNEAISVTYVGDVLQIDFGTVINTIDGDPTNDTIVIEFDAVVDNEIGNQNGITLTNYAEVTDGTNTASDQVDVTVVEPDLDVDKDVVGTGTDLVPGATVDYRITVSHTADSTMSALDLDLTDVLPAGLTNEGMLSAIIYDGGGGSRDVSGLFTVVGGQLQTIGDLDLLLDGGSGSPEMLVVTIRAELSGSLSGGEVLINDADLTWTSIDGTDAGERGGSGGINDYQSSDPAFVSVRLPTSPPPRIPDPPDPDEPDDPLYVTDAVRDPVEDGMVLPYRVETFDYRIPALPISPLYSGWAEPGTTLVLTLQGENGETIAEQMAISDMGGNWVASFPSIVFFREPHTVHVSYLSSFQNGSTSGGYNLRLYFSPILNDTSYLVHEESIENHYGAEASLLLDAHLSLYEHPLVTDPTSTYAYEFLVSSTSIGRK